MFDSVSSNVSGKVSSTISGNRQMIVLFLSALILLEFLPMGVLSASQQASLQGVLKPVLHPITNIMSNSYMRLLLFVIMLWSCCVKKDTNLFLLLAVYFIISRK
jgi:hypothetical protein